MTARPGFIRSVLKDLVGVVALFSLLTVPFIVDALL